MTIIAAHALADIVPAGVLIVIVSTAWKAVSAVVDEVRR